MISVSSELVDRAFGDKTEMELTAIRDARASLYNALKSIGREKSFDTATKEEMCIVIAAVWDGVRASMQRQSNTGDVPW